MAYTLHIHSLLCALFLFATGQNSPVLARNHTGFESPLNVSTLAAPTDQTREIPLHISLFVTFGEVDSSGVYVANDLAIKHVNAREDLLPGYELKATLVNSECNEGVAIKALFDEIFREPRKLMIIGPSCSTSAQAIASTAKFWNLNVISPTASSPALGNRNKYPTFTRIIPSDTALNPSRLALMKLYNWTRVATIHQNYDLFSLSIDDLLNRLRENNITVISSESFDEELQNQVENLKKQDAKVIAANMYYPMARKMFCEAYKHGMYGEGYVWLLLGEYNEGWYKDEDDALSCTTEELSEAIESSMYIGSQPQVLGRDDVITAGGITPAEYVTLYEEHVKRLDGVTPWALAPYGYDAILAAALAMNETINILRERSSDGKIRKLEEFTFKDEEFAAILLDAINSVQFEGVSGPIRFLNGERIGLIDLEQLRGECDDRWALSGRWCYHFAAMPLSFTAAITHCAENNAHLLGVQSEEELHTLSDIREKLGLTNISRWLTSLKRSGMSECQWVANISPQVDSIRTKCDDEEGESFNRGECCCTVDLPSNIWTAVSCTSPYAFICKKPADFHQVTFARHDMVEDQMEWLSDIIWPGGQVPLDHTEEVIQVVIEVYRGIPFTNYAIVCSSAVSGVIMSLGFFIFNVYFRRQRFMKMSSPKLNNTIIFGSILVYASTCLTGWDDPDITDRMFLLLCRTRVWFISVGFVLGFGSMFSKTWRVYKIAAMKNPKRVIITDRHLFIMVAFLLLIDVIVLTVWFTMDPMRVEKEELHRLEDIQRRVIYQPYVKYCVSDNDVYWQGALYGYEAMLLIFGMFLAWEIRKVTIPALNDSKLIGLCVYNVVLLSAIGVAVNLAMGTDTTGAFIFTSAIQIFCTSVTLAVIFVPKILSVYKYPEGESVTTMKTSSATLPSVDRDLQREEEIEGMKDQIIELQANLSRKRRVNSGCGLWCGNMTCALCATDEPDTGNEEGDAETRI